MRIAYCVPNTLKLPTPLMRLERILHVAKRRSSAMS